MKIMICIGSSCHIRGSYKVVQRLKELVESLENVSVNLVNLCGSFCMGECGKGVCIKINDNKFIVTEDDVDLFFENQVKSKL